ncbi:hypothetical protein WH50_09940 [Pokkaliibacter plantistimulans]|uniref:Prokaryotic-type class I peptide chain release factors domain-containing protein n=2 Tax=Pseudomonadota TaxID=1224 RepID=A0ABX5LZ25_9GAMM|nr:peptide chain release factor H [Pokkaliibacter plantistimulans]PXF31394.1 hypothetical protein WH50_09940 [Pokkaliibacter plantistimulans]
MMLLQLSAGQGPDECARAVALAAEVLQKQAARLAISVTELERVAGQKPGCLKSILFEVSGLDAMSWAQQWSGAMQWICESPYRPGHKRKNWFFSGQLYTLDDQHMDEQISYKACRASGPGGQHVNKTESAIQATHVQTGLTVHIASERSQHANKRLARALLLHKLAERQNEQQARQEQQRWSQHQEVQRGDAVRVFRGSGFKAE